MGICTVRPSRAEFSVSLTLEKRVDRTLERSAVTHRMIRLIGVKIQVQLTAIFQLVLDEADKMNVNSILSDQCRLQFRSFKAIRISNWKKWVKTNARSDPTILASRSKDGRATNEREDYNTGKDQWYCHLYPLRFALFLMRAETLPIPDSRFIKYQLNNDGIIRGKKGAHANN